eukprot:2401258-Amphidinium_carterae.1
MLKGGDGRQLDKLIELFYAKFSADIACAQAYDPCTSHRLHVRSAVSCKSCPFTGSPKLLSTRPFAEEFVSACWGG